MSSSLTKRSLVKCYFFIESVPPGQGAECVRPHRDWGHFYVPIAGNYRVTYHRRHSNPYSRYQCTGSHYKWQNSKDDIQNNIFAVENLVYFSFSIAIDPKTGEEMEPGHQGEIVVKTSFATLTYLGDHQVYRSLAN